jgi:antitoxin component YwqK of YwqJK toxin-antitoxin module
LRKIIMFVSIGFFFYQDVMAKGSSECDQGAQCNKIADSSGQKNGVEICKDGKGVVRRKVSYKSNLKEGLWECFNQKAQLIESRMYRNDKMNGIQKILQSSINKFEEHEYLNDQLNGVVTTYNSSHSGGKVAITGINKTSYKDGVIHGLQVTYDLDGKVESQFCYNKGARVEVGQPPCDKQNMGQADTKGLGIAAEKKNSKSEAKIQGEQLGYFKDGKIKEKFELAGRGDYDRYESYFQNGKMSISFKRTQKSTSPYSSDIYDYSKFTDKGQIIEKGECAVLASQDFQKSYCSNLTGEKFTYDEKGQIMQKMNTQNGELHGPSHFYDYENNREEIRTYNLGRHERTELKDSKTNKILDTKEFFEDGSQK